MRLLPQMKYMSLALLGISVCIIYYQLPNKQKIEQTNAYKQMNGVDAKITNRINGMEGKITGGKDVLDGKIPNRNVNKAKIELTIRLTLNIPRLVEHLLCDFLRSAVLFWNPNYGDILLILDEEDKPNNFESELNSLGLPFKFRFVYEKDLLNQSALDSIKKNQSKLEREMKNGKLRMFYSSFLMDLYTADDVIIGWTDTDAIFTIPVTDESIFNEDGKLIVKGTAFLWKEWIKSTFTVLGLPHIANFMSYFPTPVYPSTIRNC